MYVSAVSLLVLLATPPRVTAQEQSATVTECSDATLQGSFGYTMTGTLLPALVPPLFVGPFAEVGRQTSTVKVTLKQPQP